MAHAFQNAISPPLPQRTPLETMYNLKLDCFMGNEGYEGAEKWLDHIEKTFQVMQSQGNLPAKYIDRKKQEFTQLKQKNMSAHEYCRKFMDLSRYNPDTAGNQGPRKTQNFKRSGASSSSSNGGFNVTGLRRGGRFTGGPRFQRQRDFGGAGGSGPPLCRRCNFRHHEECRRSGGGCYTCGQIGHRAAQCPQS
ncbi:unnamed protein product [Malus baccata var. baccata]